MNSFSPLIMACHWLTRLAWLNLAWIGFSLLGGGVFGIFPATVMVCVMLRRYLNGASKVTIKDMWEQYRQEFIASNQTGWLLVFPTFSVLWYVQWAVVDSDRVVAVLALSLVPVALLALITTYCALIMMSCYHTATIQARLYQALQLLKEEKMVVLGSLTVMGIGLLLAILMPVVSVFYSLSPALFTAIGLLWLKRDELKQHWHDV
ncbi:DUF624 domain-containing protein [Vibrio cincinnatiensis]|jgi:uncharacterized membrane protein YesL|uniref:Uncharacterized membrane protein YesL n=1 Tax=Vibrio cincinnatiensis DSM 19608 TaxID=1123491 RepID=A0A1T4NY22_VIBCI|nr:YesL family protein [Vibrio cincinnatiensis]EGQ9417487.1 DUF624 domain-containing protein [Vibrio cholerae]MCG3720882.1 DUF624 domain-containing protein [Vibrio cincinnatiensis]MCG3726995.1 DUF624 domain-containing protein [Vibrio cincinnatiensis]MCG3733013.1 DUF624 domain-containing protein [Vibrio cincinnatiensis]MCG3735712.1 DUF624 domain-containing protein [Vibrio cincinnatiensis]